VPYSPVNLERALADIEAAGVEVLTGDLDSYGRDETMDLFAAPAAVARPHSTDEVAAVLRICHEHDVPVTPRGGGTGKAGAAVPLGNTLVLTLERMDRIREIDKLNRFAVVQTGVVLQTLHEACEAAGLLYPIDMSSRGSCLIGGNLATNAGGERAVRYGTTRDWVAGIEAVLMDGSVIRAGGKIAKNSAGYSLTQLLVGSEGTLAVITEATLRLVPRPPFRRALLAPFDSLDKAAEAAIEMEASGLRPGAVELIERAAAQLAESMLGQKLPHADAAALLLVEMEAFSESAAQAEAEQAAQLLLDAGADDVEFAPREKVWAVRHGLADAVKSLPAYTAVDTSVPRGSMPELIRAAHAAAKKENVEVVCFGHAGDGNIHVDFLKRDAADENWAARAQAAVKLVLQATVRLGGSITGEHGVGLLRRDDLGLQYDPATIEAMKALKKAWDTKGLLNPGKIWVS